ncbi:BCNT-domain-containing protein [Pleomassaria siparia CBS 279.74]|uniref:SWR1-complex protein 5 n=1 Tax=Pleomassaria siparia CBS 279.74 TaxID=1314801 RepID=A0A6G1KSU6_9PLEO|nr:BCNT-domain-containing protein [Pleomassaria siparia CBS 279.74]
MDHEDLPDVEEDYRESSDDDFNPTTVPDNDSPSSSDEEDVPSKAAQTKRKRKAPTPDDLDSGDEVTIEAARKRKARKRKGAKGGDGDEPLFTDDEGGDGGLVKTRAQRKVELKERRPLARTEGATVDVDALWAQMSAVPLKPLYVPATVEANESTGIKGKDVAIGVEAPPPVDEEADLVTIEKIYTFAGQRTTEEKQVPRSTLENHVSEGWRIVEPAPQAAEDTVDKPETATPGQPRMHRPLRRPSRFDANPTGFVRGLSSEHQLAWPRKTTVAQAAQTELLPPEAPKAPRAEKAQKLNVVDKSRLDWTGFVHQEGIAEELDVHGKTKEAYLGRMQFLAGVEAKQEEERKRMKTTAAA